MDFFIFSSFFHFFLLFSFFPEEAPEEAPNEHSQSTMDEDGEDDSSASRGEGGADAPAATPARPASASAITAIVLALGDAARAGQQRGDQARGGVPGGGCTDDAAGSSSEGQQGSGMHLAGQVSVAGDGALVNIGKAPKRVKKDTGSCVSVQDMARRIIPYLSRLARRYLAMPATSASVERLFSVAGQVVTAKRARLDPSADLSMSLILKTLRPAIFTI